ncbi:hypothetical protein [Streptomyces sp. NPDC002611]
MADRAKVAKRAAPSGSPIGEVRSGGWGWGWGWGWGYVREAHRTGRQAPWIGSGSRPWLAARAVLALLLDQLVSTGW